MLLRSLKSLARPVVRGVHSQIAHHRVTKKIGAQKPVTIDNCDFPLMKAQVSAFLESLRDPESIYCYRYSQSCSQPTLYASAYACMTKSMIGELSNMPKADTIAWVDFFDSFQNQNDGLFWDSVVRNEIYEDSDWWGARHLALHMISAYSDLGARPRHPFKFLEAYYDSASMQTWLDQYDWGGAVIGESDVDNKIMNIGSLLQYQRDTWSDEDAGRAVEFLKLYLREKLNKSTGMWAGLSPNNKNQRSRMVQFGYHLFPLFFYDGDYNFDADKIVNIVLRTQNQFGGFGVNANSSACEDIDSIELLIRFRPYVPNDVQMRIDDALEKALSWVALNQMPDGGFVFRLNEGFVYGSSQTSSEANQGAMLPTWFRILSLAQITRQVGLDDHFKINRCPGLKY